ncbi:MULTISPECIES: hypothetical protein [unclassified Yoonia]|uniref:hypothetical protein n=1 Tax=unclassified Yoonia TaxID=2629118 RepID=UPI002AFE3767|nr:MULTISPECIES: hypothetical protein [unclassified Yoonia]
MEQLFAMKLHYPLMGIAVIAAAIVFSRHRDKVRRKSLKRDDDGLYTWIDWPGGKRSSYTDPSKPNGKWEREGE